MSETKVELASVNGRCRFWMAAIAASLFAFIYVCLRGRSGGVIFLMGSKLDSQHE